MKTKFYIRNHQGQFKTLKDYQADQKFFRIAITVFIAAAILSGFCN